MSAKTKLAIFQHDLGIGGIQRSLINLLNNLDLNRYDIDLFLVDPSAEKGVIPDDVRVHHLPELPTITKFIPFFIVKLAWGQKYTLEGEYDAAIDFNGYQATTALAAVMTTTTDKIIWTHSDYDARKRIDLKFRIISKLHDSKNKHFNKKVFVSKGLLKKPEETTSTSTHILNNIIDTELIHRKAQGQPQVKPDVEKYNLVTVSRLIHTKRVDKIIRLVGALVDDSKPIHLYIIGNGPELTRLQDLTNKLSLKDHVTFTGSLSNPYATMSLMDGFISMSEFEGQGISTLEAKSLGLHTYIPMHLEPFTYRVKGSDNLHEDIALAGKNLLKGEDELLGYNQTILSDFDKLIHDKET